MQRTGIYTLCLQFMYKFTRFSARNSFVTCVQLKSHFAANLIRESRTNLFQIGVWLYYATFVARVRKCTAGLLIKKFIVCHAEINNRTDFFSLPQCFLHYALFFLYLFTYVSFIISCPLSRLNISFALTFILSFRKLDLFSFYV